MVFTVTFPGGASHSLFPFITDPGFYLEQGSVGFPTSSSGVRRNLDNNYAVRINSVSPSYISSASYETVLNYGGTNFWPGNVLTFASNPSSTCSVRVYNYSGTITFGATSSGWPPVYVYRSSTGALFDDFTSPLRVMAGTWTWNTVPSAPASISTTTNGTSVTVTRTNSASDGGSAISGYRVQRRESTNGTTWGSWGNVVSLSTSALSHTYTGLTPARYYQFRQYAVNNAGNSLAATSSTVFIAAITRYTGTAFSVLTRLRKYNGTDWQNITQARRWNGTSWQTIDLTGINPP